MSNNLTQKRLSFDACTCSWTIYVAHGGNISSRSILSRTATWTVQEQGSSSNLSGLLGSWACSLACSFTWCTHFDAVLSPRASCSRIVPNGVRYYRDLCMHKYAIDEMTRHLLLLTGQRHPIACLSHLVIQGELESLSRAFPTLN
mgnify:CR=1 FL=1